MIPMNEHDKSISEVKSLGFGVDNTYTFKSIRGGGSEGCREKIEALIILIGSGQTQDQVISALKQIAPTTLCTYLKQNSRNRTS